MQATDPTGARLSGPQAASRFSNAARLAIVIAALLAGMTVAECVVRFMHLAPPAEPTVEGGLFQSSSDPRVQYANRPGAEQRIHYGGKPEVVARVNEDGFRGPRVALERTAGRTRIACFGDSHTFGYGVGEGESWPSRLSAALERDAPGRFEVLNCGVNAFDSEQEVALIEDVVPRWQPDVVLLQFYINDTAMRGIEHAEPEEEPGFWMRLCDPRRPGWLHEMRARSQFLELCCVGIYNRVSLAYYARSRSALFQESYPGWIRARAALSRARAGLARAKIAFAVVMYPCLWREHGRLAGHDAFQTVETFLTQQSITWFDLETEFEARDVDQLRVDPRDYHAGPEAHRITGEAVARWLLRSSLLTRGGGR